MAKVLIIGAGVAGASAALALDSAGWDVVVVDKARRPGGRCATRRLAPDRHSPWFDYGAQYFTARDTAFRARVESDLAAGVLERWSPAVCMAEHAASGWQLKRSPDERERLVGPEGLNHWVRYVFEQADIDVRCGQPVRRLSRTSQGWRADLGEHGRFNADAIVLTVPPVQARRLLGEQAAVLPALAEADRMLLPCHSLVVAAPALPDCQAIFVKDGPLSWCADNSHKAGHTDTSARLWTLHAGPEFSAAHLEDTPESIATTLTREFAAITGTSTRHMRLVRTHRWRYARPGPAAEPLADRCQAARDERIVLAGDWLAGGRVEGAWLSGAAAAAQLSE
ncbi:FAD-dependent oxidoreductase [Salinisphaera sp.]|uniref:NAD(P)/FAD-dependent oxidoreductase n=1 Tax=Salinisphaera sp. TaxID=1914330 RepID=UPI000C49A350|nr:FAD-dependent oxidoreductase [Salinisphaera sp.]MBS63007.1 NAD/FAD-dependent oxidoreductase [Salinisphaera sp.]